MAETVTPDLCVIGGGAAGLAAVAAARAAGASVVLVERGRLGGTAHNSGAVPARALAAAGRHAQAIRDGAPFGITPDEPRVNTRRLHDHLRQIVAGLAPEHARQRLTALGAEVIEAQGRFDDARTLAAGDAKVRARRFVIATGSVPVVPAVPGLADVPFFTPETIFDNSRKLTHLVLIGAGALGLELAQAYARLGTQVTVVEPGAVLPGSDPELVALALRRLGEEGVDIRPHTAVTAIRARSQGIGVIVESEGREAMLDVSHILVGFERRPDIDELGIDKAGIRRHKDDARRLALTPGLRTSNRRVFAVGDASGVAPSLRLAEEQARLAVRAALFYLPGRPRPERLPRFVNTDPPIAEIGLSEAAARRRHGIGFAVTRLDFGGNAEARSGHAGQGIAKLITDRNGRILGAGLAGSGAGELAALFALALERRVTARELAALATPWPTLADIVPRLAAEAERQLAPDPVLSRLLALIRLLP